MHNWAPTLWRINPYGMSNESPLHELSNDVSYVSVRQVQEKKSAKQVKHTVERGWENYKVETVQLQSQLQKITLRVPTRRNILKHDVIPTVSLDEAVAREGVGSRRQE